VAAGAVGFCRAGLISGSIEQNMASIKKPRAGVLPVKWTGKKIKIFIAARN
jgi:hypothetical protein